MIKPIVVLILLAVKSTLSYSDDKPICEQIPHFKNVSKVEFTLIKTNPSITMEALKSEFALTEESIIESSDLYDKENLTSADCLLLPKKEGIIKIANLNEPADYLLASFGVSLSEFYEYNHEFPSKKGNKPTIIFLPIIPTDKIKRKYVFPVIGAQIHPIEKYFPDRIDPFTGKKSPRYSTKFIGRRYNNFVLAIDDGIVIYTPDMPGEIKPSRQMPGARFIIKHRNNLIVHYRFHYLENIDIKNGEKVVKGQKLGKYVTDGHVHSVELLIEKDKKWIDPVPLLLE